MDRDQSGKVSHQEFMKFMEEEFQRLDVNRDGELDVQELTRSRSPSRRQAPVPHEYRRLRIVVVTFAAHVPALFVEAYGRFEIVFGIEIEPFITECPRKLMQRIQQQSGDALAARCRLDIEPFDFAGEAKAASGRRAIQPATAPSTFLASQIPEPSEKYGPESSGDLPALRPRPHRSIR